MKVKGQENFLGQEPSLSNGSDLTLYNFCKKNGKTILRITKFTRDRSADKCQDYQHIK